MKVFIGTRSFYPFTGGVERYLSEIGYQLFNANHEVTIFTPATKDIFSVNTKILKNFIKSRGLFPINSSTLLPKIIPFPDFSPKAFFFFIKPFKTEYLLFRLLKKIDTTPDLCIARFSSEALALKKRWPHVPLIYVIPTVGGIELSGDFNHHSCESAKDRIFAKLSKPLIDYQEKRALLASDRIICFSKNSMELTQNYHNLLEYNFSINPPGIDLKAFKRLPSKTFNPKQPQILFSGRLKYVKGADIALRAFIHASIKLYENGIHPIIHFAGTGPEQKKLETLLLTEIKKTESPIREDSVKFHGYVEDMIPLYQKADLLLHTSRLEFFGQVLVEAMACSTPVLSIKKNLDNLVASDEIIRDNYNGFLCNNSQIKTVGNRLVKILSNPELLKTASINARKTAENNYTWKRHINALLALKK